MGGTNVSRQGLDEVHTASALNVKPASWPLGKRLLSESMLIMGIPAASLRTGHWDGFLHPILGEHNCMQGG